MGRAQPSLTQTPQYLYYGYKDTSLLNHFHFLLNISGREREAGSSVIEEMRCARAREGALEKEVGFGGPEAGDRQR